MRVAAAAAGLLGRLWLHEVRAGDLDAIDAAGGLGAALPGRGPGDLTDLAVEYHRLFIAGIPPYESVFLDPSAMLGTPATARVVACYRAAGWSPPPDARAAAADHLGLELLALANASEAGRDGGAAHALRCAHLALWAPVFVLAVRTAAPHPFYRALADRTCALVLDGLPMGAWPAGVDPLPALPAPPVYAASGDDPRPPADAAPADDPAPGDPGPGDADAGPSLPAVVRRLAAPREAGLFLTPDAIADLGRSLDLPVLIGERRRMLSALFQAAGQYDHVPALLDALVARWDAAAMETVDVARACPAWQPVATAWLARLARTRTLLRALAAEAADA